MPRIDRDDSVFLVINDGLEAAVVVPRDRIELSTPAFSGPGHSWLSRGVVND